MYWSEEGQKAYDNIGISYPLASWDVLYKEKFVNKTTHSPEELNFSMIQNIMRVLVGDKEYLVHDLFELKIDNIGNEKHHYKSNCGIFNDPLPKFEMVELEDGFKERRIVGVAGTRTGYSIPFSKEAVEKLFKKGLIIPDDSKELSKRNQKRLEFANTEKAAVRDISTLGCTQFFVSSDGSRSHFKVRSYNDFVNGNWEELRNFGRSNVSKDDWDRLKAVQEVAAAAGPEKGKHILEDINNAFNKNRIEEQQRIYK